jgi:integrase/recombinase XerC/integrase/recombinase XerD
MYNVGQAINQYLVEQEIRGNTQKTVEYYRMNLGYFSDFIGQDKEMDKITLNDLQKYYLMLKNRPKFQNHHYKPKSEKSITNITLQTYIRALRAFLKWSFDEGYMPDNLTARFKLPKSTLKVIEILSDEEISILFKQVKQNTELSLRNTCMIALMVDCGLRRNEVINLTVPDIHLTNGFIKVSGKGQKERIVPIGLFTKKMLMKYMHGYRSLPVEKTDRLFIDKYYGPVSEDAVKQLFSRLKQRTGITRLHPHILRHTFATKYLMNGGDIFSLQQILGHQSLDMVRRYSHLASSYITQNYKRLSPLDNLVKTGTKGRNKKIGILE